MLGIATTPPMRDKLREVIKQMLIENNSSPLTKTEIKTRLVQLNLDLTLTELISNKVVVETFCEERQQNIYTVKNWRSLED